MVISGKIDSLSIALFTFINLHLGQVKEFKYLGCKSNQSITKNAYILRGTPCFNKSIVCFIRKFSGVHMTVKECLFESLCMSLFSLETIVIWKGCIRDFDRLGTSYHYAVKRPMGIPKFHSIHHAYALLGRLTFRNLMNWRTVKLFVGLSKSENPCLTRLRTYVCQ